MFLITKIKTVVLQVAGLVLWALVLITALFAAPVIHVYYTNTVLSANTLIITYVLVQVQENHFDFICT